MCILAIFRHKRPSLDMLKKFECANNDGGGVGWFGPNGKSYYKKNLTAMEKFKITEQLPFPFVVHDRLASCGGRSPLLTHPFIVSKDSPLSLEGSSQKLLFHNGHVNLSDLELCLSAANLQFPDDKSPMSDTRMVAAIVSNNEMFLAKVRGNYAVMDGKLRKIRLYGDFKEEDGALFSNMSWKYKGSYNCGGTTYYGAYQGGRNAWESEGGSVASTPVTAPKTEENSVKDRKQKRKEWWENRIKQQMLKESNETLEQGSTLLPVKIHEEPPASHFADNTRKILGLPVEVNAS